MSFASVTFLMADTIGSILRFVCHFLMEKLVKGGVGTLARNGGLCVAYFEGRILTAEDYENKWIGWCKSLHQERISI